MICLLYTSTSKADVAYLKDSAYREKLAVAEARGILEYFGIAWKEVSELDAAVDKLAAAGIIDSPDRWKKLDFTENSVLSLIHIYGGGSVGGRRGSQRGAGAICAKPL